MTEENKQKGIKLLTDLYDLMAAGHAFGPGIDDTLFAVDRYIREMGEKGEYRKADYAFRGCLQGIGFDLAFSGLKLDPEARAAWRAVKDFAFTEVAKDLRGIGGVNIA